MTSGNCSNAWGITEQRFLSKLQPSLATLCSAQPSLRHRNLCPIPPLTALAIIPPKCSFQLIQDFIFRRYFHLHCTSTTKALFAINTPRQRTNSASGQRALAKVALHAFQGHNAAKTMAYFSGSIDTSSGQGCRARGSEMTVWCTAVASGERWSLNIASADSDVSNLSSLESRGAGS